MDKIEYSTTYSPMVSPTSDSSSANPRSSPINHIAARRALQDSIDMNGNHSASNHQSRSRYSTLGTADVEHRSSMSHVDRSYDTMPPPLPPAHTMQNHRTCGVPDTKSREHLLESTQSTSTTFPDTTDTNAVNGSTEDHLEYVLGQEVHILDSNSNELSGLTTYIIVAIEQKEADLEFTLGNTIDPTNLNHRQLTATPDSSNAATNLDATIRSGPRQTRTVYTLLPATHTTFRTVANRLSPIGYPLGTEVQQYDNFYGALVTRRFVVQGKRYYDLKDELNCEYRNVSEDEIKGLHTGGNFVFRTMVDD